MQLQQEQIRTVLLQRSICGECRAALNENNANQGTAAEPAVVIVAVKPWTLDDWQTQLWCKMWQFVYTDECIADKTSLKSAATTKGSSLSGLSGITATEVEGDPQKGKDNFAGLCDQPDPILAPACELLLMYLMNLIKNPTVPRYRRISTMNASYAKSLSAVAGHAEVLYAVGFTRKADSTFFEYDWHSLPAALVDTSTPTAPSSGPSGDNTVTSELRRPTTAAEAKALLDEAVILLTALKTSRAAFVKQLLVALTAGVSGGEHSGAGSVVSKEAAEEPSAAPAAKTEKRSLQLASASSNSSVVAGAGGEARTATEALMHGPWEEPLITVSVSDIPSDGEDGSAGAAGSDGALDFMQV